MLFLTSTTGNALAADDKACSQQERTNKTLSEKLDQTAGVICPPTLILPSRRPHPTPGRHRLSRHRAARVAIRPSSLSDPCDRGTASRVAFNRRDLAERKREPCGFTRGSQLNRRRKWGWQPRSVRTDTHNAPHPVRQPAMQTMNASLREAGTTCCLAIAVAPSVFRREGKGGEERNFPWPPKIFAAAPSD